MWQAFQRKNTKADDLIHMHTRTHARAHTQGIQNRNRVYF